MKLNMLNFTIELLLSITIPITISLLSSTQINREQSFSKYEGYEVKTAFCNSLLGGCCIYLKQYEQAEEYLHCAIDLLQKK